MSAQNAQSTARSKNIALAAMVFAVAMMFIDSTIVSIAAPTIQRELGLTGSQIQWVVNGYLLALSAAFAFGGRLADIVGHRRMVLIGVIGFAAASALCGATPSGEAAEAWLIGFRVLQGVSAALLFPAALATVVAAFPLGERGKALAIFFGVTGGLAALGPILGGWLTELTWRAIFWVNIPVAIVAVVLTLLAKVQTTRRPARLDYVGAVLVAAGMALSVLGLQQAGHWGWGSVKTWLCIVGGLILLIIFVLVELRTPVPLIRVRVFADRAFTVDNAVLFFAMMAFVPVFFFASVYTQVSLGFGANGAGLYLLIFFAGYVVAAQIGGRMLDRGGVKPPMLIGCAIGAIGFALWAWSVTTLSEGSQWPYIVIAGAGIGFLIGPVSTDAVNRSINASYGEVTGVTQTLRYYGSSLGLAILGTLLIHTTTEKLTASLRGLGLPPAEIDQITDSLSHRGGSAQSGQAVPQAPLVNEIEHAVRNDLAAGTQVVFYGMAIALVVALVFALAHPGGKVTAERTDQPG